MFPGAKIMKIAKILALPALVGLVTSAHGQTTVYSVNIVGYINQTLYAGNNYMANQLSTSNNTLNAIFAPGVVPEGTTFTEWNPAANQFLPASVYDTTTGWSIDYALTYGQGGLLDTPSTFQNTFIGSVWSGFIENSPLVPPQVGSGTLFLSCVISTVEATVYDAEAAISMNGELVMMLDAATQTLHDNLPSKMAHTAMALLL